MKKFLILIFLFIVCIVVGVAIWFSYSFNSESYRRKIVDTLSQMTGRKVEIKGPVSLTWTPFPTLSISNLSVSNQEKSQDPIMFSAEQIYAEIDWNSLLSEALLVKKVIVNKPQLLLERIQRYETNFDFPLLFKTEQNVDQSFLSEQNTFSLSINDIEIREGKFSYKNLISGEKFILNGISGQGKVASLDGPFSFSGNFLMIDVPMSFDLRIGRIETSQNIPISLNVVDSSSETNIDSKGYILRNSEGSDEWINLAGTLTGKKGEVFFKNIGIEQWPSGPLTGSFTLKIKTDKTIFESMTVRQGEGDSVTSFSLGMETDKATNKKIPTLGIRSIEYLKWKPLLDSLPKSAVFNRMATDFSLLISEAKIDSEMITQGLVKGKIQDGIVSFSDLTAQLPQGSSIAMKGTWNPKDESLDADLELQSANLRGLVEWLLKQKLEYLPEKGFSTAQLVGHFKLHQEKFQSNWKVGLLGDTEFSGDINISKNPKLLIETNLDVRNLNVDTYHKFTYSELKEFTFPKADFVFDLKLNNTLLNDTLFKNIHLNGELKDNNLGMKEFLFEKENDYILQMSGIIQNLGTNNFMVQNLKTNFELNELPQLFPENSITEIKGSMTYSGNLEQGNFDSEISLDKIELIAKGEIKNVLQKPSFIDVDTVIKSSEVQDVLSDFNTTKDKFSKLSGNMNLSFRGSGTFDHLIAENVLLNFENQSITGRMDWNQREKIAQVNLSSSNLDFNTIFPTINELKNMNFETENFPEWQVDLTLFADHALYDEILMNQLSLKMNLKDKIIALSDFNFDYNDFGKVKGEGKILMKDPLVVDGKYYLEKIPVKNVYGTNSLSLSDGFWSITGDFNAIGNSWDDWVQTSRSQGNLIWENAVLSGIDVRELSNVVENTLQNQSENNTNIQIKHALSNGKTILPLATGAFQITQEKIVFPEMHSILPFADLFIRQINSSLLSDQLNATFSILLNATRTLPTLDIQYQDGKIIFQTEAFESALSQKVDFLKQQKREAQEKQEQEAVEAKQNEILIQAKNILSTAENQIKLMKDNISLHPSSEANDLMNRAEATLDDVRSLAVRQDLNSEQLIFLQEKSNLLLSESKDLDNYLKRQDILRQREAVKKLPPLIKTRLDEMIQIYNQNPESVVLSGIVQGSQNENEKITKNLEILENVQNLEAAKQLISDVKESFQKIQKALNYARQFSSKTGILPGITGAVSEGEI